MSLSVLSRCRASLVLLFLAAGLMAGCGVGARDTSVTASLSAIHGQAYGGQQPVSGSTIQLYAVGTSGYGSAAEPLVNCTGAAIGGIPQPPCSGVISDASGNFAISGDYACPSGSYVYITATGGNANANAGSQSNSALALMAGLGACGLLGSSTFIVINEVTTVATVTALQQFMSATYGTAFAENIGAPSSNSIGIASAFATIPQMVNIAHGTALPVGTTTATIDSAPVTVFWSNELSKINTLGNILSYCVNSSDTFSGSPSTDTGISTACSTLFAAAKPASQTNAPADTIQAMLDIAMNPTNVGTSSSGLYSYVSAFPAFSPTLSSAPNDWTLSLGYYSASYIPISSVQYPFMVAPYTVSIDAVGKIWYFNQTTNASVSALSPGGTPYANVLGGALASPRGMALDTSGNIFVANYLATSSTTGGPVTKCAISGATCSQTSQFALPSGGSADTNFYAIAIDGNDNVYVGARSPAELFYIPAGAASGTAIVPVNPLANTVASIAAVDTTGNVWIVEGGSAFQEITPGCGITSCTPTMVNTYTGGPSGPGALVSTYGVAIDKTGNAWVSESLNGTSTTQGNQFVKITPSTTPGTHTVATAGVATGVNAGGASDVQFVAIDGGNNIWGANNGSFAGTDANGANTGSSVTEISNAGIALSGANGFQINYLNGALAVPTQSATTTAGSTSAPRAIAIDQAGNVWVGNSSGSANNNASNIALNEIVGAGVPTYAPLALAVKNSKLGVEP